MLLHLPISLQGTGHHQTGPAATHPPSNWDPVSSLQGLSFLGSGVNCHLFSSSRILTSAVRQSAICPFCWVLNFTSFISLMEAIFSSFANRSILIALLCFTILSISFPFFNHIQCTAFVLGVRWLQSFPFGGIWSFSLWFLITLAHGGLFPCVFGDFKVWAPSYLPFLSVRILQDLYLKCVLHTGQNGHY